MKRRSWKFALLLTVPLALYCSIAERNSWRPRTISVYGGPPFGEYPYGDPKFSRDGRFLSIKREREQEIYDLQKQGIVEKMPGYTSFFAGEHCWVVVQYQGTLVYDCRNWEGIAVGPQKFCAYDVLADGKTLLGRRVVFSSENNTEPEPSLAWDFSLRMPPHRFSLLPALPQNVEVTLELLGDKETFLIRDVAPQVIKGKTVYRAGTSFMLWNIKQKKATLLFEAVSSFASSPIGLCAWIKNGQCEIWNYHTGLHRNTFSMKLPSQYQTEPSIYALALSSDGKLLAANPYADPDHSISIWDTESGRLLRILQEKGKAVDIIYMDFSPNSRTLASCDSEGTVKLWRVK